MRNIKQGLTDGLSGLGQWVGQLESFDEMVRPVSILKSQNDGASPTLGSLVDLGGILRSEILTPMEQYFAAPPSGIATSEELATELQAVDASTAEEFAFHVSLLATTSSDYRTSISTSRSLFRRNNDKYQYIKVTL